MNSLTINIAFREPEQSGRRLDDDNDESVATNHVQGRQDGRHDQRGEMARQEPHGESSKPGENKTRGWAQRKTA